jgi:histidinol-phosphatase (PHP family)
MLQNLHTHTTFCDGKNTPIQVAEAAIAKGFDSIGFSCHAKTEADSDCEVKDVDKYISTIEKLKKEFEGRLEIFTGCELDYFSKGLMPLEKFDYKIGSVHAARLDTGEFIDFDYSPEVSFSNVKDFFSGDGVAYAELYYKTLATLPDRFDFDFVGHFDLVTKFSELRPDLIDTESKRYKNAALEALHAIKPKCDFFEINTGALARGYRTTPYPAPFILDDMKALNCKLILTSDCHNADFLDYHFKEAKEYLKSHGVADIYFLTQNGFVGERI